MGFRSDAHWNSVGWMADDTGVWHRFGIAGDTYWTRGNVFLWQLHRQCDEMLGRLREDKPRLKPEPPDGVTVCRACVEARRRQCGLA